ncbi:hypothetical protein CYY_004052 [Polysphondylium violaceum]|uniref:Uncharacterized protein n=1 Tax=Polysphondylium violaceum TaxID=133409 RepID=A0A8J4V5K3_9MYCE|nr:hypothetical protein CYY_004052 [Polysphondylium violaceum]
MYIFILIAFIVGYLLSHFNAISFVYSTIVDITIITVANKKIIFAVFSIQCLLYFLIYLPLSKVANQLINDEKASIKLYNAALLPLQTQLQSPSPLTIATPTLSNN